MQLSGELQAAATLTPGKECPITHRMVGLVGPRAGLDDLGKDKLLTPPRVEHKILVPKPWLLRIRFCFCFFFLRLKGGVHEQKPFGTLGRDNGENHTNLSYKNSTFKLERKVGQIRLAELSLSDCEKQ